MEAQELPIIEENKPSREDNRKEKSDRFSKLQSFLLIFSTLVLCLGGGYFISNQFFWSNADDNRLKEQLDHYKSLVAAEPNSAEHRVNLGYTHHLMGNNDEAIKQMKLAIDLEGDYFGAYFNLGLVYIAEGRYNDALKESQKTVELAPRDYRSHLLTGMVYRELEMYEDAEKSLKEALTFVPSNTDIINELGRLAEDQGNIEEAEELYKQALAYDPLFKPATEGLERLAANTKDNE
ncbi:MAG: tetratricopeptide repeat protein [Bacillota bacterium]